MARSYIIKKYVNNEDSTRQIATYTFYSIKSPYTMLIDYGSEENYESIQELVDSVSKVEIGGWRQLLVFWKFAKGIMLMIFVIPVILPAILRKFMDLDAAALISLLLAWGLIFYSMWGFPVAIVISMVVTFLVTRFWGGIKLSDIFG